MSEALRQAAKDEDFVTAGVHLGHAERDFRRLRAGIDEDRPFEIARKPIPGQDLRKLGDDFRDHATEQVKCFLPRTLHRLDDGGGIVADRGAHLA